MTDQVDTSVSLMGKGLLESSVICSLRAKLIFSSRGTSFRYLQVNKS